MKIKNYFFIIVAICSATLSLTGCAQSSEKTNEKAVNKTIQIAIYAAINTNQGIAKVEPALLQETVSVNKIVHHPDDGDRLTVPFQFRDTVRYAALTERNIGRHIVITADGEIVSAPLVKMRIENGACSFLLSKEQAQRHFPTAIVTDLLTCPQ